MQFFAGALCMYAACSAVDGQIDSRLFELEETIEVFAPGCETDNGGRTRLPALLCDIRQETGEPLNVVLKSDQGDCLLLGVIQDGVFLDSGKVFTPAPSGLNACIGTFLENGVIRLAFVADDRESVALYDFSQGSEELVFSGQFALPATGKFSRRIYEGSWGPRVERLLPFPGAGNGPTHVIFGHYMQTYSSPLGLTTGDFPMGRRHFSVSVRDGQFGDYEVIGSPRHVKTYSSIYAVSCKGYMYSAWVQSSASPAWRKKAREILFFSSNNGKKGWGTPERLYRGDRVPGPSFLRDDSVYGSQFENLAIEVGGDDVSVSWTHARRGFMFIRKTGNVWNQAVSASELESGQGRKDPLEDAHDFKVKTAHSGILYLGYLRGPRLLMSQVSEGELEKETLVSAPSDDVVAWDAILDGQDKICFVYVAKDVAGRFRTLYREGQLR